MQRVASLFLPQLPIERLRRNERSVTPPEPGRAAATRFPEPIDDDPGACSVPRGGGWRPGARWARDGALGRRPSQSDLDAMPAHRRPTMREMGRRSEHAEHPFKVTGIIDSNVRKREEKCPDRSQSDAEGRFRGARGRAPAKLCPRAEATKMGHNGLVRDQKGPEGFLLLSARP